MPAAQASESHLRRVAALLSFIAAAAWLSWLSHHRFIDGDEGFYVYAARLTTHHQFPYQDYFYPQMPLLPLMYGAWCSIFGNTWDAARAFSAALSAGSVMLLFVYLRRRVSFRAALLASFALCVTALFVLWTTLVKTFALTIFLLLSCCVLLPERDQAASGWRLIAAGAALGLAIATRLMIAPLVAIFFIAILVRTQSNATRRRNCLQFALGLFLGSLPWLYFAALDWEQFFYNNYTYHEDRSELPPSREKTQRWTILGGVLGIVRSREIERTQIPILYVLTLLYALRCLKKREQPDLALALALGLTAINLVPVPTYHQYWAVTAPFLILCATLFIHASLSSQQINPTADQRRPLGLAGAIAILAALYCAPLLKEVDRYTQRGGYEIGNRYVREPKRNSLRETQEISRVLNAITDPGEIVGATWPGHLFESHAFVLHAYENHFGWRAAAKLSEEEQNRYHVAQYHEKLSALRDRKIRVFIGNSAPRAGRIPLERLTALNMAVLFQRGPLRIVVPKEDLARYQERLWTAYPELRPST